MDLERSGMSSGMYHTKVVERAPLSLAAGEHLELDIFLDKAVVEVYANKKQAITRRAYTTSAENIGIEIIEDGGKLNEICGWDMMPTNMY